MIKKDHTFWMNKAIAMAKKGKTPFGAVIVTEEETFVEAYNTTKEDGPTAHAEINAIQKLKQLQFTEAKTLKLYTTVEPCPMCMSAIVWAGIGNVIFGASIHDAAAHGRQIHITSRKVAEKSWYPIHVFEGIQREACITLFKT
jgi:tRNA(Arg) A34 adenosine deaminase TadA